MKVPLVSIEEGPNRHYIKISGISFWGTNYRQAASLARRLRWIFEQLEAQGQSDIEQVPENKS
jgi:hypothetical protein